MEQNIVKLQTRYPNGFTAEAAIKRNTAKEAVAMMAVEDKTEGAGKRWMEHKVRIGVSDYCAPNPLCFCEKCNSIYQTRLRNP
jgi:hypothetical protein